MKLLPVLQILADCKLGPTALALLCLSCHKKKATITDCAAYLSSSKANISDTAKRLEDMNLLHRVKCGREVHLEATVIGRELVDVYQKRLDGLPTSA